METVRVLTGALLVLITLVFFAAIMFYIAPFWIRAMQYLAEKGEDHAEKLFKR